MNERSIIESMKAFGVEKALDMTRTQPERNIPRLMEWVDRIAPKNSLVPQRAAVREMIKDENNPWCKFIMSLWDDIDDDCVRLFSATSSSIRL